MDKATKSKAEQIRNFLAKVSVAEPNQISILVSQSVNRMLQAVYNNQTADEQAILSTKHHNGTGFNAMDATFLSEVAQRSIKYNTLTVKQTRSVAKSLRKYALQIAMVA